MIYELCIPILKWNLNMAFANLSFTSRCLGTCASSSPLTYISWSLPCLFSTNPPFSNRFNYAQHFNIKTASVHYSEKIINHRLALSYSDGSRRIADGWYVAVSAQFFRYIHVPCCLVILKSDAIMRCAATLPRQTITRDLTKTSHISDRENRLPFFVF